MVRCCPDMCGAVLGAITFPTVTMLTTPRDSPLVASVNIPFTRADVEAVA
jgi:hypothetical protein